MAQRPVDVLAARGLRGAVREAPEVPDFMFPATDTPEDTAEDFALRRYVLEISHALGGPADEVVDRAERYRVFLMGGAVE